jgi:rhodanese-related sulfurtransferase
MTLRIVIAVVAITLLGLAVASSYGLGWTLVNAKIRSDFPDVKRITTGELAAWLETPERPQPVLIDVRTAAEYDVSQLLNAHHVPPGSPANAVRFRKAGPIVTYCSVGYRSAAFAKKLQAAGYTNVVNLEGSIFRWANEGRPVFNGSDKTDKVHPYNRVWGSLLQKKYRADVPAVGEDAR